MDQSNVTRNPDSQSLEASGPGSGGGGGSGSSEHYLYLLVSQAGDIFKIGISSRIKRRVEQFTQDVDFSRSYQFSGTRVAVVNAEKMLHGLYYRYRRPQPKGSGHTEWFDIIALPPALAFIEERREWMGLGLREPVRLEVDPETARQLKARREAARETAQSRAADRERQRIERLERVHAWNLAALRGMESFFSKAHPVIAHHHGSWAMYVPLEEECWLEELVGPQADARHRLLTDDGRTVRVFSGWLRDTELSHIRVNLDAKVFGVDERFEATSVAQEVRDLLASRIRSREELGPRLWQVITRLWRGDVTFGRGLHRAMQRHWDAQGEAVMA